jgi:TPR repeat protein
MYYRGCGVAQDLVTAKALYQRSCDFGSRVGCTMLGIIESDFERSTALLSEPCALGYLLACGNLGIALFNHGQKADVARATELLDRACREDHVYYCGTLGMIVIKWKLEERFAAAQTQLERACKEQDLDSCYVLAVALEDGSLGTVDYDRAAAVNADTCHRLNHLPSCNALGYMVVLGRGREKNPRQGAWYFFETCNRGYAPACHSMGEATEKGWGGPASPSAALPFYTRGCELGHELACQRAKELCAGGSGIVPPPDGGTLAPRPRESVPMSVE